MLRAEFVRFLLVGATNTAFSYVLFVLLYTLMHHQHYQLAYALSYAAGIVLSYFLNVHFVFRTQRSLAGFLRFPFVYLIQYSLGALVLGVLVQAGLDPKLAMAGVIVVTTPVTFIASRFVLKSGPPLRFQDMTPMTRGTWVLLIIAVLSFLPSLFYYTVGEEGIYTIGTLEMLQSKDWLLMTIYGVNQMRPPLLSWLAAGTASITGWTHVVLAIRLVTLAATLGMVGWLYWLCNRLYRDRSFSLFAALTCIALGDLLLYRGWLAYTDPLFAFFIFGAIATMWVSALEQRRLLLLASVALISCALLTKALTAYVFYATAMFVLLLNRTQRRFLLSPASVLALLTIAIVPAIWLYGIPELHQQGSSMEGEIRHKLADFSVSHYLVRIGSYPLETLLRFAPASLLALYLWLRRRVPPADGTSRHDGSALLAGLLMILPYWLAPHGGIRYILPAYPLVALACARVIWRANAQALALKWFTGVIALKLALALIGFPLYQSHYRGENHVATARTIVKMTAGFPLYNARDYRASTLSVVSAIDAARLPQPTVKATPDKWDNGFVLSQYADPALGQLVEKFRMAADDLYLLCRGAACRSAALSAGKHTP